MVNILHTYYILIHTDKYFILIHVVNFVVVYDLCRLLYLPVPHSVVTYQHHSVVTYQQVVDVVVAACCVARC